MILCPNCQHNEMTGAIFCSHCGAQLIESRGKKTNKIHTAETRREISRMKPPVQRAHPAALEAHLSLHVLENGQILPLADRTEFTLGRASEEQPIVPDIDLAPYNAYENGVSRLHAALKRKADRIVIVDLGSSNGTYLNGNLLAPYVEMPVNHGDILYIGKLKLQVLINPKHD